MQNYEIVGFALSPQQRRLLSLDSRRSVRPFVAQALLTLEGDVDDERLEHALARVIARHEILRTQFADHPGLKTLLQVILPEGQAEISRQHLATHSSGSELEPECPAGQFDLAAGKAVLGTLARISPVRRALVLELPALCADAAALKVIARELLHAYAAPALYRENEPLQYADVAEHLNGVLASDLGLLGRQYWHPQINLASPPILGQALPGPRDDEEFRPQAVRAALPIDALRKIHAGLGQQHGCSDELLLLACWQVLLRQMSGDGEFVIGYAADSRDLPELQECVGPFEKYLPIQLLEPGAESFGQFCRRLQEGVKEARHWQSSFEWPEEGRFNPVCFSYYDAAWKFTAEGLQIGCSGLDVCSDRFALKLACVRTGAEISIHLYYDPAVYSPAETEQLLSQYLFLVQNTGAAVDAPAVTLNAINAEDRRRLLYDYNTAPTPPGGEARDILARIEEQAQKRPEAAAVLYGRRQLAYGELMQRANQLAGYLQELGAGPESCVALCMDRSPEMVVGLLGILKAEAAYVPLEPDLPTERLMHMLHDSRARLLLTQECHRERFLPSGIHIECIDSGWDKVARHHRAPTHDSISEDNLAYVIYTSGSTGRPKGVALTRKGLSNYVNWACAAYGCREGARAPLCSSLGFDLTITSLWPLLASGGCVVLAPEQQPMEWLARSSERPYQLVKITPAHLRMLQDLQTQTGAELSQSFVIGGEALRWEELDYWRRTVPGSRLINEYGPTETVVGSCIYEVTGEVPSEGRVPIGRPISNTQVYVLNPFLELVPTGAPGELFIGGAGLARGYLGRPDLTGERFVPNPFSASGGERLYQTGDLVRWRADGQLDYLGRKDEQVKLHGYRIELAEIEHVLMEHPEVEQSVVILREDQPGDKRLAGYLVPKDRNASLDLESVLRRLRERLPEYMVPAALVSLREIPLTSNGKLNRKALPAPENRKIRLESEEAPRSLTEQLVAGIWEQVLKKEALGRNDNFFEQGGHSLMATQVVSRVRDLFQVELPLRTVFEAPLLARLAEEIDRLRAAPQARAPIQPVQRGKDLPLSFAQQRLWFVNNLAPESTAYNIPFGLYLRGALDRQALQWSMDEIVRRHEALRTTFPAPHGIPVQRISDHAAVPVEEETRLRVPEKDRESESKRLGAEQAAQPFDLATGPLLRVKLLRFDDHEHALLVTMHHIISDGWSIGIMAREFASLYALYIKDAAGSGLPPPRVQYADYAVWQRERLQGPVLEEQLAYWKKQLEGSPALVTIPADRPRPAHTTYAGARELITFPEGLNAGLRQLSRREGVTFYMTLLAAFQSLLGRYTDQTDIVVGTTIAGRTSAEIEPLIGMFVNMLALRGNLDGNPSYRALLRQLRETMLEAYAHQEVPFERLVSELQLERNLSHSPVFQVTLELQNTPLEKITLPRLQLERISVPSGTSKFDLTVSLSDTAGEMSGIVDYNPQLFDPSTVQRFVGHYLAFLEAIALQPDLKLSEVPVLTAAEREQLLATWNSTSRPDATGQCMHHLFEAKAQSVPEKMAVVYQGQELTYRELDQRANRLAHYLVKLGVGPEARVGIYLERSVEMAVALLGVLKAGGAYVPLDPAHPAERISYMLADSKAAVLLTQERLVGRLPDNGLTAVCLDTYWDRISREPQLAPARDIFPDNLAYIYYTSGSTGRPKGVAITHLGIVNYIRWAVPAYSAMQGGGAPVHSSIAVDMTLTNFLPLFAGTTVTLLPEGPGLDGLLSLVKTLPEWTLLKLTPAHLIALNSELTPEEMARCAHALVIGGDNLPAELTLPWRDKAPHVLLVNEYGPTETVVGCCTYAVSAHTPREGSVPIGKPIENMRMYVLDRYGEPVPIGVAGELYIGGSGVARGYFERPALTAEKFVPDPFSPEIGGRLYRTGDQVRYLPDGNLEYLGRLDHQVKIRGFRIELGEIEAALSSLPGIDTALVTVREDAPGEKRLAAYVVTGAAMDSAELRRQLKERLPDYMVPASFVRMERLPVSASGKIDRKALPAPEISVDAETLSPPRTAVERILCRIWAELIGVPQIGIHDNFFQLGGDSILCIQVVARAREEGIQLTARQMFEHQTIAELSQVAGSLSAEPHGEEDIVTGEAPLSPIQAAFFEWKLVRPEHYNNAVLLELASGVDTQQLEKAVNALLLHHDVLRMRFELDAGGGVRQSYAETVGQVYERLDLSRVPEREQSAALEQHADTVQRSLDLARPRLVKAVEYNLGEQNGRRLLLVIHHLLVDGVSWRILLEDLERAYKQLTKGEPVLLPRKSTSYKTWAERLHSYSAEPDVLQELQYWDNEEHGRTGSIPLDYAVDVEEANLCSTKESVEASLDEEQTRALLGLPGAEQGDVEALLITALVRACAEWCGRDSVLLSLESHGREDLFAGVDTSRTVGWFTSLYPVLLEPRMAGAWNPEKWLDTIQEQLRAVPRRGIGYGALRYLSPDEKTRQRLRDKAQPQISFNYMGRFDHVFRRSTLFAPAREAFGKTIDGVNQRQHLIDVQAIVIDFKLQVAWSFSRALHRRETIEAVAGNFMETLRELLATFLQHNTEQSYSAEFPLSRLTEQELVHIAALLED